MARDTACWWPYYTGKYMHETSEDVDKRYPAWDAGVYRAKNSADVN